MRRLSVLTIACAAAALGGCAATYPTYVMSPQPAPTYVTSPGPAPTSSMDAYRSKTPNNTVAMEESELPSADQPRPPPRAVSRAAAARPDSAQTTGEASPSQHPRYSAEWWKEQDRVDDSLKRTLDICRGC